MPQFGFVPPTDDPVNPTTRLRFVEPARALRRRGVSVALAMPGEDWRKDFAEGCDLLIWGRRDWGADIDFLRRRHGKVVFDFTDNLLTFPYPAGDRAGTLPRTLWRVRHRERIRRFIRRFDAALVGSRWLASRVADISPRPVHVIPDGQPAVEAARPATRAVDAVWVGMNNNMEYLFDVFGADPAFAGFGLKVITAARKTRRYRGTRSNRALASELPFAATFSEWRWDGYAQAMAECRVGLAPLPQNDVAMAKTENKLLLYAALGIPFLCSDIPSYRDFVGRHGLGRICREPEDWLAGLRDFTEGAADYESIAGRGPSIVRREYGMDATATKYLALHDDLIGARRRDAG